MIYTSETTEKNAAMRTAEFMVAAARTAPKAAGIDKTESLVLDGEDKDKLTAKMRELGKTPGLEFFVRDAGNVDNCHAIVLIGASFAPRGINCKLCGVENCAMATKDGISCALSVTDLGLAVGSAASVAMDHRIDNRVLFSAGMAAMNLKLFSDNVKMCFAIGLSTSGKNIFFDRSEQ